MTVTTNGNAPGQSQKKSILQRISTSMSIGAVAGMVLASPRTTFPDEDSGMTLSGSSRREPIATPLPSQIAADNAAANNTAIDGHSQMASLPIQAADSQKPDAPVKLSLWGLFGAFPFILALLIWQAGFTRSFNMALEVCFVLSVSVLWLSYLSDAVSSLAGNDRYVIRNWFPVVVIAGMGVVWALSFWWDGSILPEKTESRSLDLFLIGVWAFNQLKQRCAKLF